MQCVQSVNGGRNIADLGYLSVEPPQRDLALHRRHAVAAYRCNLNINMNIEKICYGQACRLTPGVQQILKTKKLGVYFTQLTMILFKTSTNYKKLKYKRYIIYNSKISRLLHNGYKTFSLDLKTLIFCYYLCKSDWTRTSDHWGNRALRIFQVLLNNKYI